MEGDILEAWLCGKYAPVSRSTPARHCFAAGASGGEDRLPRLDDPPSSCIEGLYDLNPALPAFSIRRDVSITPLHSVMNNELKEIDSQTCEK
jgi:hypothetical protein